MKRERRKKVKENNEKSTSKIYKRMNFSEWKWNVWWLCVSEEQGASDSTWRRKYLLLNHIFVKYIK